MYQLYRKGSASYGKGGYAMLETTQAMRHQLFIVCDVCQCDPVLLYQGGESGLQDIGAGGAGCAAAGKSNNILARIISAPGMWLQRLTTKEPDESMVEVAIAAVEAVFDWKGYLKETFGYEVDESWMEG